MSKNSFSNTQDKTEKLPGKSLFVFLNLSIVLNMEESLGQRANWLTNS